MKMRVALALVPWRDALSAVGRGTDVYLFLAGMMLLAELARQQGVFDWLAALAAQQSIRDFICEYVGRTPLPKGFGTIPAYLLRRARA